MSASQVRVFAASFRETISWLGLAVFLLVLSALAFDRGHLDGTAFFGITGVTVLVIWLRRFRSQLTSARYREGVI